MIQKLSALTGDYEVNLKITEIIDALAKVGLPAPPAQGNYALTVSDGVLDWTEMSD